MALQEPPRSRLDLSTGLEVTEDPVRLGLLGAGRIGQTHARSIADAGGARLVAVADPIEAAVASVVRMTGTRAASAEEVLADAAIEGVLIATPTDLHADLIERAAESGKVIFCEKPIDLDLSRAQRAVAAAARCGVPLMVGFNRRFDPSFRRLRDEIAAGRVGTVELVQITSRDPAPPPMAYIERSGGLFRDMMIHDLDMARFLVGEPIVEVTATGSAIIDKAVGDAGDVDTAVALLRSASGRLCVISNSRRATYGYDQRIEVHGSEGMISAGNPVATTVTRADRSGFATDPLNDFFMERYADAYRRRDRGLLRRRPGRRCSVPERTGWSGRPRPRRRGGSVACHGSYGQGCACGRRRVSGRRVPGENLNHSNRQFPWHSHSQNVPGAVPASRPGGDGDTGRRSAHPPPVRAPQRLG